jgi:hypothetical protein
MNPFRRALLTLLALGAVLAQAAPARAQKQSTGSIGVSVTIPYPLLTGTGIRPLNFGTVIPSAGPVTVLPSYVAGSLSGEWRLTGTANQKSVDISFNLPTQLTASGGRTMAISFDGSYAGLCEVDAAQTCQTTSWVTWNPKPAGVPATFHDTPQRWKPGRPKYEYNFYSVFIGGQLQPTATQPGGTYSGTVGIVLVIN